MLEAGHGAPKHPDAKLVTALVNRVDREGESSLNSGARSAASAAIARLHLQASPPGVSQPLLSSHPPTHTTTAHRRQLPGASARHKGDQMDPRTGAPANGRQSVDACPWAPPPWRANCLVHGNGPPTVSQHPCPARQAPQPGRQGPSHQEPAPVPSILSQEVAPLAVNPLTSGIGTCPSRPLPGCRAIT